MITWLGNDEKVVSVKEVENMKKNRDEFANINKTKNTGRAVVVTIAVLAICITGILYARKLQLDQEYITMDISIEDTKEA